MKEIIENGLNGLVNLIKEKGIFPDPKGYYNICNMCVDLRRKAMSK